ncbi:MAG TPA: sigma-70 family RNA polymerase sigma factor [Blastocatellia bacterium]|nr:sigma-70 family RNA polymerase sigma factor [Blastocatellia bacterium]
MSNSTVSVHDPIAVGSANQELRALVEKIAAGDEFALSDLYDLTSSLVYGLVLRMLTDRAAADEVVLDVYKQVWRQAALYDDSRGSPLAWLVTIARTRSLDRLRGFKREQQLKQSITAQPATTPSQVNPEQASALAEIQQMVRAALDALTPEQREVIELAYYGGLSHTEIATRLGQPLGTVKTRTRLGMMKLRELLSPLAEAGL